MEGIAPSSLSNDVVEEIFSRLPVKTLIRFKPLSKQWRSTIESQSFAEIHLKIAERSHVNHPKVMVFFSNPSCTGNIIPITENTKIGFKTICSESAFFTWSCYSQSCDGLFCIQTSECTYVVNAATRWFRQLPLARFQILNAKRWLQSVPSAAFVKTADYKLSLLHYNSFSPNMRVTVTECEVFDFRANAWRHWTCTPSYRLLGGERPASANGSVYWFVEPSIIEIKVIAFDIHTEKFRLLTKIHPLISSLDCYHMCNLDNRLCLSTTRKTKDTEIWRLNSSEDTWEKIYTIDFISSPLSWVNDGFSWKVVAICKNKKILLSSHRGSGNLVIYDPLTKSVRLSCTHSHMKYEPYFQSLISHI
ncbi:hypothetical protein EUTSA_v10009780mg [Eutrema salsugineum]|uniref:F-box domain-containing protein n=1 Tax=Eutrema salsugineum TaxID=72664 RepID=V4KW24_EUTSA|nr:hypothetical protein EUTSA_v10009780mg [Eutrema salsugineum]